MKEIVFSASTILASVVMFMLTLMFPPDLAQEYGVGPGFFPRVTAVLMFGLGMLLLLNAVRRRCLEKTDSTTVQQPSVDRKLNRLVLLAFLIIVSYAVGIYFTGFLIGTLVFLLVMISFFLSHFEWRRFLTFVLPVSVLVTFVTYAIFRIAIRIPLPRGVLF